MSRKSDLAWLLRLMDCKKPVSMVQNDGIVVARDRGRRAFVD